MTPFIVPAGIGALSEGASAAMEVRTLLEIPIWAKVLFLSLIVGFIFLEATWKNVSRWVARLLRFRS